MINYELKLPTTKKTKDQIAKDWMIDSAKRPSSNGYYDKFKNRILEARKKDEALVKEKKRMNVLDWIDSNVAMYEPDTASDKQKAVLKRIQDETKLVSQRTESNNVQRIHKVIEKKPNNVRDPSFKKKPTSPVEIDWNLPPMQTAGLWSNIKNSSIYKLLDNPQVIGVELGHESIVEIINLLQNSGLLKDGGRVK